MESLGIVLKNLGDYAEAKTYLEKALKINEKHYGHTHPDTAKTIGNLGLVLKSLGQYEKARECYQKTIKVYTKRYGANHAKTKRVKRNLAKLEKQVASKNNQKQPKVPKIDKAKKQEVTQRPEFCKSHLEKSLILGQINQLRGQFQSNEDKRVFDID